MIELLVSIIIIVALASIALIDYKKGKDELALERTAYKLAQDIRRVEEMAMGAEENVICSNPNFNHGYGVTFKGAHFSGQVGKTYKLFADCNGNESFDGEDIDLPIGTTEIDPQDNISTDADSVVFTPPDPTLSFSPPGYISLNATITSSQKSKTVIVNGVGLIYVQ